MFDIKEELAKLPNQPGVYLMKNDLDQLLYVGKAISLKSRVKQYFQSSKNHSIKTIRLVEQIKSFEYIVTSTEVEALVLECNLIKQYSPKYNIRLKDDKHYPYIKVDVQNVFPKVAVVREMKKDGAKYFGPYTDVNSMWEMMEIIKKTWKLRTCSRVLPRDINKERACLNYHIGQCSGPCTAAINKEEYRVMIDEVVAFLSGKYKEIIVRLEEEMAEASEQLQFEKAALVRDQLSAIKKIEYKQAATNSSMDDQDVIAFGRSKNDTLMQVYFVRQGKLVGREHFLINETADEKIESIFRDFIVQFYAEATFIPKEIIVEKVPEEYEVLEAYLAEKKGTKVKIVLPQKGHKHQLLELASKNAYITLSQFGDQIRLQNEKVQEALKGIQEALGSSYYPKRIEAYDISNTQGVQSVGAMIVFEDGKPKRSDYRKFKIKSILGPNDYGSMEEVLDRRLERLKKGEGEDSFLKKPDLILMDGGKGQVSAAKKMLDKHGLSIPVCGMVKDEHHRTRGLLYDGETILIDKKTESFKLITRIQDEVHRFAIEYHKKLRSKAQVQSILDDIKGVGKERKKKLIQHFKSVEMLRQASQEQIQEVDGIPIEVARTIYQFFHPNE
ncbi:MAG: excinuclease ABC subunit UvrC [Cellulosilyticaceae bacterium]